MSVGKRIYLERNLPDPKLIDAYSTLPTSNVADVLNRNCGMNPRIKLMSSPSKRLCGPAYTVKTRAGDNLTIHAALNFIGEGDVLVISNEGASNRSLMGEVMINYLFYTKKIAGLIMDGPMRDIDSLKSYDFPIYANGTCPGGPYKEGPGEINVPISCGEIPVNPGDIILGDEDGVVVIPRNDAAEVLPACQAFVQTDAKKALAAKNGQADRSWVEKLLAEKGYEIIQGKYPND